ncbi:flavin-containing monooxygenase [Hoyosella altamirensis]|uniref:Cyclohexanone monooxygenase n=1 Tax=Hoyosella altamirensis TaxID=616997 RepID=A0A839RRX0_9ACTN|nr:NAD(P)/FAD-dependent oxidoreductase [Hoyosella altamirensis]MBB3038844.1 cyclohexanone monooxygenase [Hoyosella altamirensis]
MTHYDVLIIGAGISGIGAAITLARKGIANFAVLEKGDTLGGTWRDNTYPGCACDVPSRLYSYSFAPNPNWSRVFAGQPEIREYIERTATEYGVPEKVQFRTEVTRAQWNPRTHLWDIDTTQGSFTAQAVIAAAGPWNEPLIPDIPGLAGFGGEVFHSSRWNHSYDLTGKRVAVVGTGASAVQFVPEIQPLVSELHVYQRTAQWVLPKPDHAMPAAESWAMRTVPGVYSGLRRLEYVLLESLGVGFRNPWILRLVQQAGRAHLFRQVRNKKLRAMLTPDYTLGCKRLLMSNTYYPALTQPNVEVHPNAVTEIRGNTVVGADGQEREVDAIIFGTGFHILDMPVGSRVFDGDGRSLDDHWKGSPQAYLGTAIAGFPNAFVLLGPALGTGHTSAFMILEAQLNYLSQAIIHLQDNNWAPIAPRREVQDAFNAEVQEALDSTVYNAGGCHSYYLDVNGRNSFSWPWSTKRMLDRLDGFDPAAYSHTETETAEAPA